MSVPELSHLQILVLDLICSDRITGRELREKLSEEGERKSGPAFYQLMSRLEDASLVKGEYTQKIVEGQIIKERVYELTSSGRGALREAHAFYSKRKGFAHA